MWHRVLHEIVYGRVGDVFLLQTNFIENIDMGIRNAFDVERALCLA